MSELEAVYSDEPEALVEDKVVEKEVQGEIVLENIPEDLDEEVLAEDEPSEAEAHAIARGWNPEGVEGKRPLSADEFNDRESFFDRIHKLEKHNKSLQGTVDEMATQHSKIADLERTKVMDELKERKKTALAEEDYDAVIELDERLAETREIPIPDAPDETKTYIDPDFTAWQEKNSWYDEASNPSMFSEATALGEAYHARTGKAGTDMFGYVEQTMKRMYPDKFDAPQRGTQKVERAGSAPRKRAGPKKHTKKDLNDNQRRVMNTYVKRGVMTEDEYISELAKIGELG